MKKNIKNFNLEGKKIIIRCDFNVPIKNSIILDNTRIKASLKTIQYAIDNNAKVILLSHLSKIKTEQDLKINTLKPVSKELAKLLNIPIKFVNITRGPLLEETINNMQNKEVILIENTRFEDYINKYESNNDESLGKYWASLGDIFINDAFGTIHRKHASNVGIANHIESGVGFLVEEELQKLSLLNTPNHPFTIILGGAKVEDKINVIKNLIEKADNILIGGGMAFTFLKAKGYNVGNSLIDENNILFCKEILEKYPNKIVLPLDVKINNKFEDNLNPITKNVSSIEDEEMGLDIGEDTVNLFNAYINNSKMVLWNGPLGVYEFEGYKKSTEKVLENIVSNNIKTVLGGGDIVAASKKYKDEIFHISTGGGATLKFLEGSILPGLEVINNVDSIK